MAKKKHNSKSRNTARNGIAAGSTKGLDAFAKAAFQEQVHQFQNRGTSISDIFEGLDFDHFHIKRRISSVLALVDDVCQHVNSLCPDVPDCFSIAEDWITINAFPVSAYDYVENQICSALGAAIWILDNIRDQGKIQELTAILDSAELPPPANLPPVWDACHSQQLLATMVSIINHRNADCPLQKKQSAKDSDAMFRCYMDRCSAEGKIDPDVPSRILFNRIVDLLDPAELSRIKTCYIEKFWDWLHRYYQCRAVFVREEMGIRGEIEAFHATAQQIAGAPAPQISVPMADHKNLLSQQEYQQRMLQLKELDQKNGILYIRQEDFNKRFEIFFREVGEFSMLPYDTLAQRYGEEIAKIWASFEIAEPYSMCAAFLLLLDEGSDLPWCYFPGVNLQSYYVSMLPWTRTKHLSSYDDIWEHYDEASEAVLPGPGTQPLPKKIKVPDPDAWYQMTYSDRSAPASIDGERHNLSHVLYEITGCIMPRNLDRHRAALKTLHRYGINSKKDNRYLSYCAALLGEAKHQSEYHSHGHADDELLAAKKRISELEKQLAGQGQEISDLRQLLFGSKGSTAPLGIHFPYRTGSHIIVFGGAEPWLNQMKEKLPDITFLEGVRKDLLSQLRKADMIWLQTDGMSRDVYQSIIREVSKHNLSLRYFSNAVVADCADQLINADIASC